MKENMKVKDVVLKLIDMQNDKNELLNKLNDLRFKNGLGENEKSSEIIAKIEMIDRAISTFENFYVNCRESAEGNLLKN